MPLVRAPAKPDDVAHLQHLALPEVYATLCAFSRRSGRPRRLLQKILPNLYISAGRTRQL